jgi:uncharacterized protein
MTKPKRQSPIRFALGVALIAYLGMLILLTGCQKRLIYYPERVAEEDLLALAARMGVEEWRGENGEFFGWQAPAPEGSGPLRRVVVFHGNAGMALDRTYYVQGFQWPPHRQRWEVYLFEYPGYGARSGVPGEKVFYEAAGGALAQLLSLDDTPLMVVGESLGSGVAARMAADFPGGIDGLVLVTPFTSLPDVAARHFWAFPVRLLLRERFDNVAALQHYAGPVAIVLAEHDEVIPADLGERLYENYEGPKKLWVQKGKGHNTLDLSPGAAWWVEFAAFLEEHGR